MPTIASQLVKGLNADRRKGDVELYNLRTKSGVKGRAEVIARKTFALLNIRDAPTAAVLKQAGLKLSPATAKPRKRPSRWALQVKVTDENLEAARKVLAEVMKEGE